MDKKKIEKAVKLLLEAIGENLSREGLRNTPSRVARMYEEIFCGINQDLTKLLNVTYIQEHDEVVLLKDIPFFSICEHHLVPFFGKAHVAYLPAKNRVTGISKLARVVDMAARKPQLQERLTSEIADAIMTALKPRGVMVVLQAEHLCLTMRGVKKPGSQMVTSAVRGIFRTNPATRAEAFSLINR